MKRCRASGRRLKIRSSAVRARSAGDFGVRGDVRRVDDGHIQPGLHGVVQHDAVQHRAGPGAQAKGDIAHPQRGQHARQFALDQADAFQRLDGRIGKFRVAGCQGEGQGIEDQAPGAQAVFVYRHVVDAPGNLQLGSAVLAMPFSSMVSTSTAALCVLARERPGRPWRGPLPGGSN